MISSESGPPSISVLMSVLNGAAYLRQAVDSILAQSEPDFEFIIIDNASTDDTAEILDTYLDPRIVRLRNDQVLTLTQSLNKGLTAARGEYIARLDADDVAAHNRFERQRAYLRKHSDCPLVASHARYIDADGVVVGQYTPPSDPQELYLAFASSNPVPHSAVMFRRRAAAVVGGYPALYAYSQDYALWLALVREGKFGMIGEPLVDLRVHPGQSSLASHYQVTRHQEAISLFQVARRLPGLPRDALRLNCKAQVTQHLLLARQLFRLRRWGVAVKHLTLGFCIAPCFAARKVLVGLSRSLLRRTPTAGSGFAGGKVV